MEMLKKLSVALLLVGSCGIQAMHEGSSGDSRALWEKNPENYVSDGMNMSSITRVVRKAAPAVALMARPEMQFATEPEVNTLKHIQAHPTMYESASEGFDQSMRLKPEFDTVGLRVTRQAASEGITVDQLMEELGEGRPVSQDENGNLIPSTPDTVDEGALRARERDSVRRLEVLGRKDFGRVQRTQEQEAADEAQRGLDARRHEFARKHFFNNKSEYKFNEDSDVYNPTYTIKPEYREAYEAALENIK